MKMKIIWKFRLALLFYTRADCSLRLSWILACALDDNWQEDTPEEAFYEEISHWGD